MITQILVYASVALTIIWWYLRKKYSYFRNNGINHMPVIPLLGNEITTFTRTEHPFIILDKLYRAFPNDRFVGHYEFTTPVIVLRDLDLIKKIAVKDFDNFTDHRSFTSEQDQFLSKSLFGMKGSKWRNMRVTLSPAFTASKLRNMVPFIQECGKSLENYLIEEAKKTKDGHVELDSRDLISRIANDVIATCAFGLKTNSITDRDNVFYKMGSLLTNFGFWVVMKFIVANTVPYLEKLTGMQVFSKKAISFFRGIFLGTMRQREEKNIYRPDMLQLLMEAQKGTLTHDKYASEEKDAAFATVQESSVGKGVVKEAWDDTHIVAQAMLFFFAGFDTVTTAMVFLLHELARNPQVLERLQREIDDTLAQRQGAVDYETINQMKYLDMCVSETLRKWAPTGTTDRVAINSYNMGKPNENAPDFIAPAGTMYTIPLHSIHRDEKYYPEPEKFDPERFSDENKDNIKPFSYLPFGIGPRNCIGSRFALAEIKIVSIAILRHFDVKLAASGVDAMIFDKTSVSARLNGGDVLRFQLRK